MIIGADECAAATHRASRPPGTASAAERLPPRRGKAVSSPSPVRSRLPCPIAEKRVPMSPPSGPRWLSARSRRSVLVTAGNETSYSPWILGFCSIATRHCSPPGSVSSTQPGGRWCGTPPRASHGGLLSLAARMPAMKPLIPRGFRGFCSIATSLMRGHDRCAPGSVTYIGGALLAGQAGEGVCSLSSRLPV